ncbi:MAG TPA: kelch repeat-containing protein [Steroidobacteraceae bacterium]|nr:kelch repeat-containing protein [Steroidobacteraceae bacterium]
MTNFPLFLRAAARAALLCAFSLLAAACHDVVNGRNAAGFVLGGSVTGLITGAGVQLANGNGEGVLVSANGVFDFPVRASNGSTYNVSVFMQPAGENCAVGNAAGTIMGTSVSNVSVVCTPTPYAVGGSVGGLLPGRILVLQDNGANATTVSADGTFVFSAPVPSGSNYAVTVHAQPDGQTCAVGNGSGTIAANAVLNVSVVCSDDTYNVAVTVSGVNASGLTLENDGGDTLSILRNGSFDFDTPVPSGSTYAVTVSSQPTGEICTVTRGAGTITDANVANVAVACIPNLYSVSGTLSGLYAGRSIVLQDNGANTTTLSANGSFGFSAPVASGSPFAVTVLAQPVGQTCAVNNGSGTVAGANVTSVAVICSDNSYNVSFTVSGLLATGLMVQDNGTDNLAVSGNGTFNFNTPLSTGSPYSVSILAQPANQTCAITDGSGTVIGANITGVLITCTGEWTWMGGASTNGAVGMYGTVGTPSTGNIPGARYESATFTDLSGKFWLFGGYGLDGTGAGGDLNDLWNYNPATGAWTWVNGLSTAGAVGVYQGTPASTHIPGARGQPSSWTDPSGKFWLFGGFGYDSAGNRGPLNDLWMFDPLAGIWTWMSGSQTYLASGTYGTEGVAAPGNVPGARTGAVSWTDSAGSLWLFGGQGHAPLSPAPPSFNDLWKFDRTTGLWTWESGLSTDSSAGVYGTQGVAAAGNMPGARSSASAWVDSLGNLWLFGGSGYDSAHTFGYLNDLWKFNPNDGTWTWEGGSDTVNGSSSYGAVGIPAPANVPGARDIATAWVDSSGNFWLFGGVGLDSSNNSASPGNLADLWEYSPATGLWTWIAGSSSAGAGATYGTLRTPAFGNGPGSRQAAAPWVDSGGNLWMLGGSGVDSNGNSGFLNDLWRYTP